MIGPQMNSRIETSLAPSCSTDAGITAICRRVAVGTVGGGIAPAVEDHDVVDGDLDAVGEARQKHRPGRAASPAGRTNCPVKRGGSFIAFRNGEKYGSVTARSTPASVSLNAVT